MPSKKTLELREFSIEDLNNEIGETETQYQKMKFDHAIKGLDDPLALREVRRDLARLKTEARRRALESMDEKAISRRSKIRARRAKQKKS
jgi:large subunit ribosomal protein L29